MAVEEVKTVEKNSYELAEKFCPQIFQEWKSIKDCITRLVISNKTVMNVILNDLIQQPFLYYHIKEDDTYYYAFYMVPHLFDWSDSSIEIIKKLDSHLYDTEALCFRINKKQELLMDVVTCFHHSHKFSKNCKGKVFIQAEGHGILPYKSKYLYSSDMMMIYNEFKLVDLSYFSDVQWEFIKNSLAKQAKIPHEQVDEKLSFLSEHKKGDIYLRPNILFSIAEKKGLI